MGMQNVVMMQDTQALKQKMPKKYTQILSHFLLRECFGAIDRRGPVTC